jgi:competence protein ComEA
MGDGTSDARLRESLATAAAHAYEAVHGSAIPDERRGFRWAMTPRQAVAAALALVALAGGAWWATQPHSTGPPLMAPSASVSGAPAGVVVVDVAGAVASPGVFELPAGARVGEAIAAAGGTVEGAHTESINLARVLNDGEQVLVPREAELGQQSTIININTASAEQLDALPGVGPALAAKIIADRDENGPFNSLDDLDRVSGVGPSIVSSLDGLATV